MKRLITLLIIIGMLISAGGCTAVPLNALMVYGVSGILATTILCLDLDAPVEYEGGAWFVEPNESLNWQTFIEKKIQTTRQWKIRNADNSIIEN